MIPAWGLGGRMHEVMLADERWRTQRPVLLHAHRVV